MSSWSGKGVPEEKGPFSSSTERDGRTTLNEMATEQVSMDFPILKHLAKHSKFSPVPPTTYRTAELLWSTLLEQACSYDKACIDKRTVLNKSTRRLHMLAKLIYVYEEMLWKPEHYLLVSQANRSNNSQCQSCANNLKRVGALQTQLAENDQRSVERERHICMLKSQLREMENTNVNIDEQLTQSYAEVKILKDQAASTAAIIAKVNDELDARCQLITSMQSIINNFSKVVPNYASLVQSRQDSPEGLPSAGQKGGSRVRDRSNCDSIQQCKGKKLISVLKRCKSKIVKSASLAMEQFKIAKQNTACTMVSPKRNMAGIRCFACAGLGHIARYCTLLGAETPRKYCSVMCFKCGHFGHIARNCHGTRNCKESNNVDIKDRPSTNGGMKQMQNDCKRESSQSHVSHHVLKGQNDQVQWGKKEFLYREVT